MSGSTSDDVEMLEAKEISDSLSPTRSGSASLLSSISPAPPHAALALDTSIKSPSSPTPASASTTSNTSREQDHEQDQDQDPEQDDSDEDDSEEENENENGHDEDVISVSSRENSVEPTAEVIIVKNENEDIIPEDAAAAPTKSKSPLVVASTSAKPTSSAATTKPKSKAARPRSPSPSPPPPPPPKLQTIRLNITLGGPDNYEIDISSLAKETGQRPPTPTLIVKRRDESDSEGDDDEEKDKDKEKDKEKDKDKAEGDKPASKKRKKKNFSEYDTHDPFIDDSELALDERQFFGQTKQQGFYVSSGEVALVKDKTPKKPKSKKPGPSAKADPTAGPSNLAKSTSKREDSNAPITLLGSDEEDGSAKAGQKRKRFSYVVENGKKRKIIDINDFHPELQQAIDELKGHITKENWDNKGKFPPGIKPILAQVALKAVALDEYDEDFFSLMPQLFPYNKFTMSKLIKRTIFQDHVNILNRRQEDLLAELKRQTEEGFPKAQEEWEKTVVQWQARQDKAKEAEAKTGTGEESASAAGGPSGSVPPPSTQPAARQSTEDAGSGMELDPPPATQDAGGGGGTSKEKAEPHPPSKKFRMTESMKNIVWSLVSLSNECCRLENEKNGLEGSNMQISEQGLRKQLYQKIVAAFPEGWMSSGQISRDVSSMKKRAEKEAMENES